MKHYLGMDVSKAKLDCSLLQDASGTRRKAKNSIANNRGGIDVLLGWCKQQGITPDGLHVIMESTGVYHEQAALALCDAGVTVSIVNPAQVRNFARGIAVLSKTDSIDSLVLARYGALLNPAAWTPPTPAARTLQALLSRREALAQDLQRERNRQEKAEATETPARIHQSLKKSLTFLERQLSELQKEIDEHIDHHPDLKEDRALLQSIPGVGPQVGNHLLSVMHRHVFMSAEQLAAYLGLVPIERQSGTSVLGRVRLSKNGPAHIRAILYMAAVVAIRHNPHIKALYARLLAKGKSKMSAIGAAMRKLVHLCFGVLKTRTPYRANYVKNT